VPDREHVVLVLPGIGGSLLAPPGALDRPVWSASPRDLGLLRRPEALSTAAHPRLVPVGLVPTRKAMPFWTPVHGYNGLLRRLGALPGAVVDDGTPARRDLTVTREASPPKAWMFAATQRSAAMTSRDWRERPAGPASPPHQVGSSA
jgi:hypothetical protein